ncbi:uncharacterized protein PHACADRAFT_107264 [Phanerochaete carnosa HHB-10118-sp]|uniref:CxC1-like cysteine cluster associated with KDZ transposases domain-containing protein n=1 Tax=Phanerochaete carnosa (strain HHB-10118-sp) TaxID=650164 RepID=K5WG62_PHACS|nr:uncharacterized protein PHACADRAFT_107264 [Phanerochaete carnosa HHB-10118-sp]EKM49192.1 hypothetical protein PHACADRAFT_107264 [Phanerochaete carnosa HHB-10118-sp]
MSPSEAPTITTSPHAIAVSTAALPPAEANTTHVSYTVQVFCLFSLSRSVTILRPPDSVSPALDLMLHGYIAKTPTRPTTAVSIKTIELLYRIRRRKASFSIEAFAKLVCDYYRIPYRAYLRNLFADTFEVYVRVIRDVERRIHALLGWDTPDWRPLNACRACCYKVKGEPPLRFSRIICLDGNNSLKRVATTTGRTAGDTRSLDDASYYLPRNFVDQFSREVRGHQTKNPPTALARKLLEQCVKNWKAAAGEEKKQMWRMFDESGLFASACRHGFILWIVDMVRSGELAKYPLAIMRKILDVLDPDFMVAYDIGCSFETTTKNSSLGNDYHAKRGSMCVPAFHGYTHSHICQLQFHPNVIEGMGIEDAETLERVFGSSNMLAPVIRYASPYRRTLFIEEYFKQWDEEKYLNSGAFMLNNYTQSLEIIEQESVALSQAAAEHGVTEQSMQRWTREEREFFATLGEESEYDVCAIAYVELLQELRALEPKLSAATSQFIAFQPSSSSYSKEIKMTTKLEVARRHAIDQHSRITLELVQLEVAMGLTKRWTPLDESYKETLKYMRERHYLRALEKLQKLVVQRLFELDKLNIAETGKCYKMRTHLSKSLQVRCKTIRKALEKYNSAAAAMNPPRPPLEWDQVSHYSFLEEFTLLQDTRNDVRNREWAKPVIRESIKAYRRLNRAKVEISRLNCEVARVHTGIRDETVLFHDALASLTADDPLHGALLDFIAHRTRVNDHLLRRIEQIYVLPGFTGQRGPGEAVHDMNLDARFARSVRLTSPAAPSVAQAAVGRSDAGDTGDGDDSGSEDGLVDDDTENQMGALIQYIAELALL